jgi:tetratricopeptide (TPR) repeat protein
MKPSRLQLRLEDGIKSARSMLEADCLRAERAGYLARIGQFEEVRAELAALHERYDPRPNVEMSAWLNLIEGLLVYFSAVGLPTNDKVKRSFALSCAANLTSLRAISSAWLAQFDYVRLDMNSMAANLRSSLQAADLSHHSARSRASLVVAQALHLAGRLDFALPWYRRARDHAGAEGDDATTSALMHNMGWLRMMELRQRVLSGTGTLASGDHALMNAESTSHFDMLTGDTSWNVLKPILRAQILSLQGDFASALALYDRHLTETEYEGTTRLQANLMADKSWCLAKSGEFELAHMCAVSAIDRIDSATHTDDRAAAHSRLAQVFSILDDNVSEKHQIRMANEAWHSHELLQAQIFQLVGTMTDSGTG